MQEDPSQSFRMSPVTNGGNFCGAKSKKNGKPSISDGYEAV